MRRTKTTGCIFSLAVLLILGGAVTKASECGDGDDGSVPNCCVGYQGVCEGCRTGYGITEDKESCVKCRAGASCLYCDGDSPTTCLQAKEKPVANCLSEREGGWCVECSDGYDLNEAKKDDRHQFWGVQTCTKCKIENCQTCSAKKSGVCERCDYGYGLDGKGKSCVRCEVPNCNSCGTNYRACQGCDFGDPPEKPAYGLIVTGKGKKKKYQCKPCPKGCFFCDGDGKCHDDKGRR